MENDRAPAHFPVGEPLENIGQLVRLNLAEARGAILPLTSPRTFGAIYGDVVNEPGDQ